MGTRNRQDPDGLSSDGPLIFISTGDLSGDMHAAHLVSRLREEWTSRHPEATQLRFAAAGASHLDAMGVEIWEDTTFWGAMGIFEGMKILPRLLAAKKRMVRRIRKEKPALVIAVDYRSLNMSLLKDIRKRPDGSIQPTAYYISPVFWWTPSDTVERKTMGNAIRTLKKIPGAEKKGVRDRFDAMAELVDLAFAAYPFNLDLYDKAGMNYRYIGHPLGQIALKFAKEGKYLKQYEDAIKDRRPVCVAPGSRLHELRYHMPILVELIERLQKRYKDLWFYCPVPSPRFEKAIRKGFGSVGESITFVPDDCYDLMSESDLMIVKSGTSVQLALLLAVPAVTFYKLTSEWMENIGRRFFQEMPYYAFPNLLAGKEVIPELIQSKFTLPNMYIACTELLDDVQTAGHMRAELSELRKRTMKDDPIGEAAKEIIGLIERKIG